MQLRSNEYWGKRGGSMAAGMPVFKVKRGAKVGSGNSAPRKRHYEGILSDNARAVGWHNGVRIPK